MQIKNDMAIPSLKKITINMGVGKASQEKGKIDGALNDMKLISGQQPVSQRQESLLLDLN